MLLWLCFDFASNRLHFMSFHTFFILSQRLSRIVFAVAKVFAQDESKQGWLWPCLEIPEFRLSQIGS